MRRFRTHWLALLGAALLLALSVSSAFGAHPEHSDNRGNQVSSFVHELLFGTDEDPEEEQEENDEGEDVDEDEEELEEEEQSELDGESNHGQCVREWAKSLEVGGPNENHGGAVSFAARFTCWEAGDGEEAVDEEEEESAELTTSDSSDGPGKSAAAHQRAPGKNKAQAATSGGHGRH